MDEPYVLERLFRGRTDVYPKRWINSKKGTKGYAPACANEWVRGVCEKPRVKCGECPNQAFIPVTEKTVHDHFRGRHVIGVYPMLEDETCPFLAVDFDKGGWRDDVAAFTATCRSKDVPFAVERSLDRTSGPPGLPRQTPPRPRPQSDHSPRRNEGQGSSRDDGAAREYPGNRGTSRPGNR